MGGGRGLHWSKFFSNPAIVISLSGCGVKSTPPLGEFGVSPLAAMEDRENGTLSKKRTVESLKVTQLELQVHPESHLQQTVH